MVNGQEFCGVAAKNIDPRCFDWPKTECLLWILNGGDYIKPWEDFQQQPHIGHADLPLRLERVLAHHELNGEIYFGVKWEGYTVPAWETERDLDGYAESLTDYCLGLSPAR